MIAVVVTSVSFADENESTESVRAAPSQSPAIRVHLFFIFFIKSIKGCTDSTWERW